jgi:hypothetical protein
LAGNLNSDRSYLIRAVSDVKKEGDFLKILWPFQKTSILQELATQNAMWVEFLGQLTSANLSQTYEVKK